MTVPGKGGAPRGQKKSPAHKAKISKAQQGKKNSNYDKGQRLNYREIAGAKEGEVVHHKSGKRDSAEDHRRSNLQVLRDKPKSNISVKGRKTTPKHEQVTKRK